MKIAIFLPNWVGDVVMATPTLQALRAHLGSDASFIGVMRPGVTDVLGGTRWFDRQFLYQPGSKNPRLTSRNLVRCLRQERLDSVLLLTNSLRTGILGWLSGARKRVGYAHYGRGPLLTEKLRFKKKGGRFVPSPTMSGYLKLAHLLGCPTEASWPLHLETTAEDEAAADRAWERLHLPDPRKVVVFHNAGGRGGAASAKAWPMEYAAQLASRVATDFDLSVLILCGPEERATAAETALRAKHPRVKSLADQSLSLGLSKACVRRSRVMVSSDSGPRHFAAAFGVPLLTLFGPTHRAWGDTQHTRTIELEHSVPCGPCMQKVCPLGHHRCMRELSVDRVYRAFTQLVEKLSCDSETPLGIPA